MLKRIVITGAPGSGKTSLIKSLKLDGYTCIDEISRKIFKQGKNKGIKNFFIEKPKVFSLKILKERKKQYKDSLKIKNSNNNLIFFDRGIHDVYAYLYYINKSYVFPPRPFKYNYQKIFILNPWKSIYLNDNERFEDFNSAVKINEAIKYTYKKYGFELINVPKYSIKKRKKFIIKNLI
tara:strand:- start:893 stop:1429 length:537 start_codon:yes stop_codon:yes gene_type:complete